MFLLFISDNKLEVQGIYSMTPEQRRVNGKAFSILSNLAREVSNGAIGAQYDQSGGVVIYPCPSDIVDKDGFEENVITYEQILLQNGTPIRDVRNTIGLVKNEFYAGTPIQQVGISSRLSDIIGSFENNK